MTRSPLQVLAEYCGHEWRGSTHDGCYVIGPGYTQWMHKDVVFGVALDKLETEGLWPDVAYFATGNPDFTDGPHWEAAAYLNAGKKTEVGVYGRAPTRIEALAKLVEKLKEGK